MRFSLTIASACMLAASCMAGLAEKRVFARIGAERPDVAADIERICRGKATDVVLPPCDPGRILAVCRERGVSVWISPGADGCGDAGVRAALDTPGATGVLLDWRGVAPSRMDARRLAEIRKDADRRGLKLAVRVPDDPETCAEFGFDAVGWAKAGLVDIVVPSPKHFMASDIPVEEWRAALSGTGVLLVPDLGDETGVGAFGDAPAFLRGVAGNFYALGADGVCVRDGSAPDSVWSDGFFPGDLKRLDYDIPVAMGDWPAAGERDDAKHDAFFVSHRGAYQSLQTEIDAKSKAGGGRVEVEGTVWCDGPVVLKSGVELHFRDGAKLVFNDNPARYPAVMSSWEGVECINHSPLIYAFGATNVAITGRGTIAPRMERWKEWIPRTPEHMAATRRLYDWCSFAEPVENRDLTKAPGANARPQLVMFNRCANVRMEGLRIRRSPFWCIHLFLCDGAVVKDVDVVALGNNNDGLDIEMSRNVLVEGCSFRQGDDAICIKAGRNRDGWRLAAPSENIEIRNCTIHRGNSVVGIGSEMSGGVRNVWIHDCVFDFFGGSLLHLKTNERRGGFIENVRMERMEARGILAYGILKIASDSMFQWREFPTRETRITRISGIHLKDVRAERVGRRLCVRGDARCPIAGICLENVRAAEAKCADVVENAEVATR